MFQIDYRKDNNSKIDLFFCASNKLVFFALYSRHGRAYSMLLRLKIHPLETHTTSCYTNKKNSSVKKTISAKKNASLKYKTFTNNVVAVIAIIEHSTSVFCVHFGVCISDV